MTSSAIVGHPTQSIPLDDEILALTLQLEEISYRNETRKGKNAANKVPDLEVAYADYLAEIETQLTSLKDIRLAHSIANAVDTDAQAISELAQAETQAQEDRQYAMRFNSNDAPVEAPPPYTQQLRNDFVEDEVVRRLAALMTTDESLYEEPESEAGPSVPYAKRQASALKMLSQEFQCSICREYFRSAQMIVTKCKDRYCADCMKTFFMRATRDESLFPPRCCKQEIPLQLVAKHMSTVELAAFEYASLEFTTADRVYCSNHQCGKFIPPTKIESGSNRMVCDHCTAATCSTCKNAYHYNGDCPDDPALRQTRELAREMGWQSCYRCSAVVQIKSGCNHMTYGFSHFLMLIFH